MTIGTFYFSTVIYTTPYKTFAVNYTQWYVTMPDLVLNVSFPMYYQIGNVTKLSKYQISTHHVDVILLIASIHTRVFYVKRTTLQSSCCDVQNAS